MTNPVTYYLNSVLPQLPVWLVWAIGITLALLHWQRHPRVSLLAALGLGLALTSSVVLTLASSWVILNQGDLQGDHALVGLVLGAMNWARAMLHTLAWICVLGAIFSGRQVSPYPAYEPEEMPPSRPADKTSFREGLTER